MTDPAVQTKDSRLLLRIRGLQTFFHVEAGTVRAVDHVDVEVNRGQTLGIVESLFSRLLRQRKSRTAYGLCY